MFILSRGKPPRSRGKLRRVLDEFSGHRKTPALAGQTLTTR